jgi:hypothetical protein
MTMARRRMIGTTVFESDDFLDLPIGARAFYPFAILKADDNGLLNNMRTLMCEFNAPENALPALLKAGFILDLGDNVYAITHWEAQNHVPKSKYTPTAWPDKLAILELRQDNAYHLKS